MKKNKLFLLIIILIFITFFSISTSTFYNFSNISVKREILISKMENKPTERSMEEDGSDIEEKTKVEESKINSLVLWVVPIIGVAIGAFLKFIGEYLVSFLTYYFGRMKIRKLPKIWSTTWSYYGEDESEEGKDILEINQIGTFIRGRTRSDIHNYSIKGRLYPDGTSQGIWKTNWPGKSWHGTFHMLADLDSETIRGMWIGKLGKDPGKVRGGSWIWKNLAGDKN